MKFAVNSLIWTAAFHRRDLPLLAKVKHMGFDGIEIARFDFDDFPAAEIRDALAAEGLECTFCSALTGQMSLVSDEAAVRNQARDFLARGIETAAELGARIFMGPFCAPVGLLPGRRPNEDEWQRAVEGLQSLGPVLDACDVTLTVEPLNRFETYFLNTAADAVRLCRDVSHPRIGVLFDTFHGNIEEKDLGDAIRLLGPHLRHFHACENDRGIPGTGHIEWGRVFDALYEIAYDGWVVIESFGSNIPEIAAAACIWRDLAPSSDAIAAEGLKFLKDLAGRIPRVMEL